MATAPPGVNEAFYLAQYAVNSPEIYSNKTLHTIQALARHRAAGTYENDKALKMWLRVADFAALHHSTAIDWRRIPTLGAFTKPIRADAARFLSRKYADQVQHAAAMILGGAPR